MNYQTLINESYDQIYQILKQCENKLRRGKSFKKSIFDKIKFWNNNITFPF